jgi:hypothetical protein
MLRVRTAAVIVLPLLLTLAASVLLATARTSASSHCAAPLPNSLWSRTTTRGPPTGRRFTRPSPARQIAAVAYWPEGAEGRGVVLSGDTIQVVQDRRWVSFMYSYPNLIPLSAAEVQGIAATMRGYPFTRLYGAFGGLNVLEEPDAVERSAQRYVQFVKRGKVTSS